MSPTDRFVTWLLVAMLVALAVIAIAHYFGRRADKEDLREYERRAEARVAEFRGEQRKRRHAIERAEFRERLRREKEGGER